MLNPTSPPKKANTYRERTDWWWPEARSKGWVKWVKEVKRYKVPVKKFEYVMYSMVTINSKISLKRGRDSNQNLKTHILQTMRTQIHLNFQKTI